MDIEGLGEKLVDQLVDANLIERFSDIYTRLSPGTLASLDRFGEKSAHNLLNAIEMSKTAGPARLLFGLGIRHVGEEVARQLISEFGGIPALLEQDWDALLASKILIQKENQRVKNKSEGALQTVPLDGIGEQIIRSLKLNLADELRDEITRLEQAGVQIKLVQRPAGQIDLLPVQASGVLAGLTVVVTGTLPSLSRDEVHDLIRARGGKVASSISSKTSLLLAGEAAGSKLIKAHELAVKVITEAEFLALINPEV